MYRPEGLKHFQGHRIYSLAEAPGVDFVYGQGSGIYYITEVLSRVLKSFTLLQFRTDYLLVKFLQYDSTVFEVCIHILEEDKYFFKVLQA